MDDIERLLAQKTMLDFRYWGQTESGAPRPMTELPDELAELIAETGLGGVALFAENCMTPQQLRALTDDLQAAAARAPGALPLLIAIDQEGGRVVRTSRDWSSGFAGNMAIGATYDAHGIAFAERVGAAIGAELSALGVNLNCAPCVDVNSNPDNPVIGVRSFGDDPQRVAELGLAGVLGLQSAGVLACAKHFPGHGDTDVDSHTGLPRVEHDRTRLESVELLPFEHLVRHGVDCVMTAHIQCPALDDTEMVDRRGRTMTVPATLSRRLLRDRLRSQLGFTGLVITDALDMAAIADHLTPEDAMLGCFAAGADLALMPCRVRSPQGIAAFRSLLRRLADSVRAGAVDPGELTESAQRIEACRRRLRRAPADRVPGWPDPAHRALERELAQAALTVLPPGTRASAGLAPQRLVIGLADPDRRQALRAALAREAAPLSCVDLPEPECGLPDLEPGDLLLFEWTRGAVNLAAAGGAEDRDRSGSDGAPAVPLEVLLAARQRGVRLLCLAPDSPYLDARVRAVVDAVLLPYHDYLAHDSDGTPFCPALEAVAAWLGGASAGGVAPVRIEATANDLTGEAR